MVVGGEIKGDRVGRASVIALRMRHHDDTSHSDHVCGLATRLFIGALDSHGVSPLYLRVLQAGSLLHNVGLAEDPANHHTRGRDIIIGEGLRGYSDDETRMVACLVAFHRKPVEPEREPLWRELPTELQDVTLRLAAILRVADGLDYTQDQATRTVTMRGRRRPRVTVSGPGESAQINIPRAKKKSDLWKAVIGRPPTFALRDTANERWDPPVGPRQTFAASAETVLRTYLAEILAAMPGLGTIDGIDPRHDVRVALRRFRSGLRLYRKLWSREQYDDFVDGLRRFGMLIGEVRDRDVRIEWLDAALAECPDDARGHVAAIRRENARERRAKLRELIGAHRDERFSVLLRRADTWAQGSPTPVENLDASFPPEGDRPLGAEVLRVLRKRAKRIRAYKGKLDEHESATLHALRRDCRRMRYATEAWYDALGPGRAPLRNRLKAIQDALGDVHDADVRMAVWSDASAEPAVAWLHERCGAERAQAWKSFQNRWSNLLKCLEKKRLVETAGGR